MQPTSARDEEGEKKDQEKDEEEKPLISEQFLDPDDWKSEPSKMKAATYMPLRYQEEAEKGYYFVPSAQYSKFHHVHFKR